MFSELINVVSAIAFIALLGNLALRLRRIGAHWSSPDGLRCVCQMAQAMPETQHKWHDARIHIDTKSMLVRSSLRGSRARQLRGMWKVIGVPHDSQIAPEHGVAYFALSSTTNTDTLAVLRVPASSASSGVLANLITS